MSNSPRMDFLVRRMLLLAGEVHDFLVSEDWEAALEVQAEFDNNFNVFQHAVESGNRIPPKLHNDLTRLHAAHAANQQLMDALKQKAGLERGRANTISRIGGYAPGANSGELQQRFVDGSA